MDELNVGSVAAAGERHPQRVEDEISAHVGGKLPADDAPAPDVDHKTEKHVSLPRAQVREVSDPQLVGSGRAEATLDEVGAPLETSGVVVRQLFARRFAPWMLASRISRATWSRPTWWPARRSAFHIRLEP